MGYSDGFPNLDLIRREFKFGLESGDRPAHLTCSVILFLCG